MDITKRPFSRRYTLAKVKKKLLDGVDSVIRIVVDRIAENAEDREKSAEILTTLADLHSLKKTIEQIIYVDNTNTQEGTSDVRN
jgi:hypothetical protein